jgi:FkbM family methyltransferase
MQKSLFIGKIFRKSGILQKGWLSAFNFNLSKKLGKTTFKVPVLKNIGWSIIFENEPWMTELLELLLPLNAGIFVDVGVNIGQTLLKVKSIDRTREYFGFEVNPYCIAYLKELIKVNNLNYINIMPFGLSDKTGLTQLQFYYDSEVDVTASIIQDYRPDDKVVKSDYVILSRLDDLELFSQKKIGIIKVDVEGAELEVIIGAKRKISEDRPKLIIEILPAYTEENVNRIKRQRQIESIFKDLNYNFFLIKKDNENHFRGLIRLDAFQVDGNISQCDYLLIPEEKIDLISHFSIQ